MAKTKSPAAAKTKSPAEALALTYLREARHWTQTKLANAKGHSDHRLISRYENSREPLSRAELHDMAALLGFSRDAVEALLFTYSLVIPPDSDESGSLVELTPEELRRIGRTVLADGWTRAAELRARLIEDKTRKKAEAARRQAGELWARLKPLSRAIRRELVEDAPDFQTWALAVRLCEQSERAAAHDPEEALALADLALSCTARVMAGGDLGRSRLTGYAWAYKGNAQHGRQVGPEPALADRARKGHPFGGRSPEAGRRHGGVLASRGSPSPVLRGVPQSQVQESAPR